MLKSFAVRISQGRQYVKDPRKADPVGFRGKPVLADTACPSSCDACVAACPAGAVSLRPLRIDLGRCMFCTDCAGACPEQKISFTNDYRLAGSAREGLLIDESHRDVDPVRVSGELRRMFGRSLKLRSVSAGGCNGCELEINALSNVNFDIGRYGIDFVASPRHADGLVLSGPITTNMAEALQRCWDGMPEPKFVIAVGACAISGSPFEGSASSSRAFLDRFTPQLFVPGCPPHPLTFVCGILDLLGIAS
jgi:Ni,Fe-hydrogenase III small subunit/ferredoxin